MRIATQTIARTGVEAMQNLSASLSRTQRQISTGRRMLSPSDDPAGSAQALALTRAIAQTEQHQRNAEIGRNRLALEEQVMIGVGNILQRVRELALQANNATQTDETRGFIAAEVREMLDELIQLANTRDSEEHYLFAGYSVRTQPFVQDATGVQYRGDQGQRLLQIGEGRQIADGDSGAHVFQMIRNGNGTFTTAANPANTGTGVIDEGSVFDPSALTTDTYTVNFVTATDYEVVNSSAVVVASGTYADGDVISFDGIQISISGQPAVGDSFAVAPSVNQDMFGILDDLITALETRTFNDVGRARLHNDVNTALTDLDRAIGHALEIRTRVGSRLSAIEVQKDNNEGLSLQLQETLSGIQDLDYAEALTRLNQQLGVLEAAQQSFVRVQNLSLFNFL